MPLIVPIPLRNIAPRADILRTITEEQLLHSLLILSNNGLLADGQIVFADVSRIFQVSSARHCNSSKRIMCIVPKPWQIIWMLMLLEHSGCVGELLINIWMARRWFRDFSNLVGLPWVNCKLTQCLIYRPTMYMSNAFYTPDYVFATSSNF